MDRQTDLSQQDIFLTSMGGNALSIRKDKKIDSAALETVKPC